MKKKIKLRSNYLVGTVISILNIGMRRRLRFIKIINTDITIRLLRILYREGVIRTFVINNEEETVSVYFKYIDSINICSKLSLISVPSKRARWGLNRLHRMHNNHTFTGFYIVSTPKGFVTIDQCLLSGRMGGEVLIRVELS